jgi:hypothetical protein
LTLIHLPPPKAVPARSGRGSRRQRTQTPTTRARPNTKPITRNRRSPHGNKHAAGTLTQSGDRPPSAGTYA